MSVARPADRIASCGDASCEFLIDPIPRPTPPQIAITLPEARRVVFVDNRKPNSMAILRRAQRLLAERGIEVEDEILEKPDATRPMAGITIDRLSEERGLILSGVAD